MVIGSQVAGVPGYCVVLLGSALSAAAIPLAYRTLARAGMASWL